MEICVFLEKRMIREIDAMPYNLTPRQAKRLVTKAVKRQGRVVARKFGIENPNLQALADLYLFTKSFPTFPNEAYIELLKGAKVKIAPICKIDGDGIIEFYKSNRFTSLG